MGYRYFWWRSAPKFSRLIFFPRYFWESSDEIRYRYRYLPGNSGHRTDSFFSSFVSVLHLCFCWLRCHCTSVDKLGGWFVQNYNHHDRLLTSRMEGTLVYKVGSVVVLALLMFDATQRSRCSLNIAYTDTWWIFLFKSQKFFFFSSTGTLYCSYR